MVSREQYPNLLLKISNLGIFIR